MNSMKRQKPPGALPAPQLHLRLSLLSALPDSRGGALCPQTSPRPASAQRPPLRPVGQALPCGAGGGEAVPSAPRRPRPRPSPIRPHRSSPSGPWSPHAPPVGMRSARWMTRRHASSKKTEATGRELMCTSTTAPNRPPHPLSPRPPFRIGCRSTNHPLAPAPLH